MNEKKKDKFDPKNFQNWSRDETQNELEFKIVGHLFNELVTRLEFAHSVVYSDDTPAKSLSEEWVVMQLDGILSAWHDYREGMDLTNIGVECVHYGDDFEEEEEGEQ